MQRRDKGLIAAVAVIASMTAGYAALINSPFAQASSAKPGDAAVLDAIRRNPEIVLEALQELQRRDAAAKAAQQSQALAASREAMLDPRSTAFVGNPEGDVTMVEFSDYNCGFCKRAAKDVAAMVKADPKLRVAIKEMPVLGPDSLAAARIATAAKKQLSGAAFLAFHLELMDHRGKIDAMVATRVAAAHGADVAKLEADALAPLTNAAIDNTLALGERLGITGTPAFVIGEEVVPGAIGEIALSQKVSAVRKCGKATC